MKLAWEKKGSSVYVAWSKETSGEDIKLVITKEQHVAPDKPWALKASRGRNTKGGSIIDRLVTLREAKTRAGTYCAEDLAQTQEA